MSEPVQPAPAFSLRAEQELSRTLEQYCRVPGQEQVLKACIESYFDHG